MNTNDELRECLKQQRKYAYCYERWIKCGKGRACYHAVPHDLSMPYQL